MAEDLLEELETILKDNLNDVLLGAGLPKFKQIDTIPNVILLKTQHGFPALGILDEGDRASGGVSEWESSESINLAVYVKLFDRSKSMSLIRKIKEIVRQFIQTEGSRFFPNYCIQYTGSGKVLTFSSPDKDEFILFKNCAFTFKKAMHLQS